MKIIVSAAGRFHVFYPAEQVQKGGYLCEMIAAHYDPKRNAKGIETDSSRIASNGLPDILAYIFRRFFKIYQFEHNNLTIYEAEAPFQPNSRVY